MTLAERPLPLGDIKEVSSRERERKRAKNFSESSKVIKEQTMSFQDNKTILVRLINIPHEDDREKTSAAFEVAIAKSEKFQAFMDNKVLLFYSFTKHLKSKIIACRIAVICT